MSRLEIIACLITAMVSVSCPKKAPPPEKLITRVEIAGCRETRVGPICEIEDDVEVVLWVDAEPESQLRVVGVADAKWKSVDGGWQTTFEVTTATKSIDVIATRTGRDTYKLPVVVWKRPPRLVEADEIRTKSATTALAILEEIEPTSDVRTRADIATMRARIAFAQGQYDEAVALRRESATLGDEAGLISRGIYAYGTIAWIASMITRDVRLAETALRESSQRLLPTIGPESAYISFYNGMLARELGDFRSAIRHTGEATRAAHRLNDSWAFNASQLQAGVLALMGLHEEVSALFEAMASNPAVHKDACASATFFANRAWTSLLAQLAGSKSHFPPSVDATEALRRYSGACPEAKQELNMIVTLAWAYLQRGDLVQARQHINSAKHYPARPTFSVRAWLIDADAKVAQKTGQHDVALRRYADLEQFGEYTGSAAIRWRGLAGRASVLEEVGALRRALLTYERAEQLLDDEVILNFGGAEGALVVDEQDAVATKHAGVYVRLGSAETAAKVLRRNARRRYRGLERGVRVSALRGEDRARWRNAAMEHADLQVQLDNLTSGQWASAKSSSNERRRERDLILTKIRDARERAHSVIEQVGEAPREEAPVASDEFVLTVDRISTGWVAIGRSEIEVRTVHLVELNPRRSAPELSRVLIAPFADLLGRVARIRIVARGPAQEIDFHALPFEGRPLIASHVIRYASDAKIPLGSRSSNRNALVVADPSGDLPSARDEATGVSQGLRRSGWTTTLLTTRGANRRDFIKGLDSAVLLHWAGHGRNDPRPGFTAALPLASRATLGVGDILMLPDVPELVVLSGCSTASLKRRQIGPARAFVLAGAREVVAASRPVLDSDAWRVTAALYDEPDLSLAVALQHVQTSMAKSNNSVDWAAFRVLVP